jgi:hypothetical protein
MRPARSMVSDNGSDKGKRATLHWLKVKNPDSPVMLRHREDRW